MRGGGSWVPSSLPMTRGMQLLLLSLALLCVAVFNGGGGASASADGVIVHSGSTRMTQEGRVRAAMARKTKTVLRLTGDVVLTREWGMMTCPDLTVVGRCKTRSGRPRRCKIDGRKRFSGIIGDAKNLTLDNLEISGFVSSKTRPRSILGGNFILTTITNCLVTGNVNQAGTDVSGLFNLFSGPVVVRNSQFVHNKGKLFSVFYSDSLSATNVLFRSNVGGPLITHLRSSLLCDRCIFERNKAAEGAAVLVANYGSVLFSRSSFIGNSLTRVGARGGAVNVVSSFSTQAVTFCNCFFKGNTIALPGRKTKLEHVYLSPTADHTVAFCKKRPAVGVNGNLSNAIDSCEGCPA